MEKKITIQFPQEDKFSIIINKIDNLAVRMDNLENRMVNVENRMVNVENRIVNVENRMVNVENRMLNVEKRLEDLQQRKKSSSSEGLNFQNRYSDSTLNKDLVNLNKITFSTLNNSGNNNNINNINDYNNNVGFVNNINNNNKGNKNENYNVINKVPVFGKNKFNNIKNIKPQSKNRSLPKNINAKFFNPNPGLINNNLNKQLINNKKKNSYISIMEAKIKLKKRNKGKK